MTLHSLCRTVLVATSLVMAPAAQAQTPRFELRAEWASEACVLPARFRVTLINTGETAFAVPERAGLGYAAPVNFRAVLTERAFDWNGDDTFSSSVFRTPPPAPDQPLISLSPGASHAYELPFDGIFDAHGGPVLAPAPWRGRFVFYYSLPKEMAQLLRRDATPVPAMDAMAVVVSNALVCG